MKELSLHVLDIVQNSIRADASLIEISILEDPARDILSIEIKDNGRGMDEEMVRKVQDPFFTTRTTRKVGLGIPLFAQVARDCGGNFVINSEINRGTVVKASFIRSHIDRPPLGSMIDTIVSLVAVNPIVNFLYRHRVAEKDFVFDTSEIKKRLEDVPISHPVVLDWIKGFIEQGLREINGGADNVSDKIH
jgi:anti-sigma regulatory factor (Ser/Thr protein kinase)